MRRGQLTVLILGLILLFGGRFETVRAEVSSPAARRNATGALARPAKHLHDAGGAPGFLSDEIVDRCSERDDDETWLVVSCVPWTSAFLSRRIASTRTDFTARSRREESRNAHRPLPLRC
jgi:hypothetical protein